MKWKLIVEDKTPSDMKSIEASFNKDVSDEKYTPTVDFVRNVYNKMNKEFFFNCLPTDNEIKFEVVNQVRNRMAGEAIAQQDLVTKEIAVKKLVVNGAFTFTLHDWMETILHEMIHVCDYVNFPQHFDDKNYDPHGSWFMNEGKRFTKYGFDVSRTCKSEHGISDDNERIVNMLNKELFIQVGNTNDGTPEAFKILTKNKDKCLSILKERGYKQVVLLASENPKSVELKPTRPTKDMSIRVYRLGDEFTRKYGPFKKVEDVDLTSLVFESDEEKDGYLKTLHSIKGLESRKIGNHLYELRLS